MFQPGILGLFINPYYFARKGLATHIRDLASHMTGKTLDIGCGTKPYEKLCPSSQYIGLELDSEENRATKPADCCSGPGSKSSRSDACSGSLVSCCCRC